MEWLSHTEGELPRLCSCQAAYLYAHFSSIWVGYYLWRSLPALRVPHLWFISTVAFARYIKRLLVCQFFQLEKILTSDYIVAAKSLTLWEYVKAAAVNRPRCCQTGTVCRRSELSLSALAFHQEATVLFVSLMSNNCPLRYKKIKIHTEGRGVRNGLARSWHVCEFVETERQREDGKRRESATKRSPRKLTLRCHV